MWAVYFQNACFPAFAPLKFYKSALKTNRPSSNTEATKKSEWVILEKKLERKSTKANWFCGGSGERIFHHPFIILMVPLDSIFVFPSPNAVGTLSNITIIKFISFEMIEVAFFPTFIVPNVVKTNQWNSTEFLVQSLCSSQLIGEIEV